MSSLRADSPMRAGAEPDSAASVGTSDALEILACPDCRQSLSPIQHGGAVVALHCGHCEVVFPVIDGIYVLLSRAARNYELEHAFVQPLLEIAGASVAVVNTLELLNGRRTIKSWEWEDEEFWAREYSRQESGSSAEKNWNDRLWPRQRLIATLLKPASLAGKTLVDVGCGEGQNFRGLLRGYGDDRTLYIAIDITMAGLRLNRRRNGGARAIYILGSANALPLKNHSADVLCYWGILHHTERRAATLEEDIRLLRANGCVFLHEALKRPSLLPTFLKPREEESAHEERIPRKEIAEVVRRLAALEVVTWREMHSAIYTGAIRYLGKTLITRRRLFWLVTNFDSLLVRTVGRVIPFMRGGTLMLAGRLKPGS
jgi:ubiquinone/menaquinone biosynthesis C-methylase UbiE/uncharacterized protein YbaR (Trm112 family)